MLQSIWKLLRQGWQKYNDFVREAGLDEGNCRRCVPIIRHDPPAQTDSKWLPQARADQKPQE